jgi:hypothetical protein
MAIATTSLPTSTTNGGSKQQCFKVPKGFLPMLFYAAVASLPPIFHFYVETDLDEDVHKIGLIVASALAGLFLITANDCVTWFLSVLFFHIGVEVKVIDIAYRHATDDATSDEAMVLSWVALVVIVAHLLVLLLVDHPRILTLTAWAGVVVNAATVVYIEADSCLFFFVAFSSAALLFGVQLIACMDCVRTSIRSQFLFLVKGKVPLLLLLPYEE